MALFEILDQYKRLDKPGLATDQVAEIAEMHFSEVLSQLPIIPNLLKSTQLGALIMGNPTIVKKPVTTEDLLSHLEGATEITPEIGIDVFADGTNVVRVGSTGSVFPEVGWTPFAHRAVLDFHTHPDPGKARLMRQPSLTDLDLPLGSDKTVMIGSTDGMTYVPRYSEERTAHVWRRYVTEIRGFDKAGYEAHGAGRVYEEFLADIVKPVFVPWSDIEPSKSLTEIAEIVVTHFNGSGEWA